jgi:anti-sigma B factor antagonist
MEEVTLLEKGENGLKIALSGDIDLGNAERFYEAVMDEYRAVSKDILFDCEKLNFIDSTTLGTFVKILKTLKQDGNTMKLINLQSKIKKLFLICSLDSIMEIA